MIARTTKISNFSVKKPLQTISFVQNFTQAMIISYQMSTIFFFFTTHLAGIFTR